MDWRSHAIIGTMLAAIAFYFMQVSYEPLVLLSIFAGFSALLPDIDLQTSKIRSITDKSFIIFAMLYSYITNSQDFNLLEFAKTVLLLIGIYFMIVTVLKPRHRGITHTLAFSLAFSVVVYVLFDANLALAGAIGYTSHLLADGKIKMV